MSSILNDNLLYKCYGDSLCGMLKWLRVVLHLGNLGQIIKFLLSYWTFRLL